MRSCVLKYVKTIDLYVIEKDEEEVSGVFDLRVNFEAHAVVSSSLKLSSEIATNKNFRVLVSIQLPTVLNMMIYKT